MMSRFLIVMLVSVLLPLSVNAKNAPPEINGVMVMYDLDAILVEGVNFASVTPLRVRLDAPDSHRDISTDCTLVNDTQISCDFFPEKLPPAGNYRLVVSNGPGEDKQSIAYDLIIGAGCDMDTDQASYTTGETLTISSFAVSNPTAEPVPVEWKGFLEVPTIDPIGFVNLGADGTFVLPVGFAFDFGPFPLFVVKAGFPAGTYTLGCRVLNPVTGALLNEDLHSFDIVH